MSFYGLRNLIGLHHALPACTLTDEADRKLTMGRANVEQSGLPGASYPRHGIRIDAGDDISRPFHHQDAGAVRVRATPSAYLARTRGVSLRRRRRSSPSSLPLNRQSTPSSIGSRRGRGRHFENSAIARAKSAAARRRAVELPRQLENQTGLGSAIIGGGPLRNCERRFRPGGLLVAGGGNLKTEPMPLPPPAAVVP